jgi:hypothetical protein
MKTLSENKLFTPILVGPMKLKHRVDGSAHTLKVRSAEEYSG